MTLVIYTSKCISYLCHVKNAIIIVVSVLFMVKPILPLLDYGINYNYIVKELCVNKEVEKNDCNGKCHLKKELAQASDSEIPLSNEKKQNLFEFEFLLFIEHNSVPLFLKAKKVVPYIHYSNLYANECYTPIFHPPVV